MRAKSVHLSYVRGVSSLISSRNAPRPLCIEHKQLANGTTLKKFAAKQYLHGASGTIATLQCKWLAAAHSCKSRGKNNSRRTWHFLRMQMYGMSNRSQVNEAVISQTMNCGNQHCTWRKNMHFDGGRKKWILFFCTALLLCWIFSTFFYGLTGFGGKKTIQKIAS